MPRWAPARWSTSSGAPRPPTQACTSTPPTGIVSSRGRMRRIMLPTEALADRCYHAGQAATGRAQGTGASGRTHGMTYDLLIKNGRIIDGSGRPAFHGNVGVARGKSVELGRLGGAARQVIEAAGRVVAPGFVDNHGHYDARVLWEPLCTS